MRLVPLNLFDEGFVDIDTPREPWSIQLEVRASGALDPARLADALRAAAATHPMARARLREPRLGEWRRTWEIHDRLDGVPLAVVDAASPDALARARSAAFSACPPLDAPPPFAATLARHPEGDYLLLNVHHAAADGVGTLRFMTSVIRRYAGKADPVPRIDPLAVRDLAALAGSASLEERVRRGSALLEVLATAAVPPARIAGEGGDARARGYGFVTVGLAPEETARVAGRKGPGTVNDVLLAALARTIALWNDARGAPWARVSIMVPVNIRPEGWWHEVIANFASYVSVSVPAAALGAFARSRSAVTAQMLKYKQAGAAGLLVDLLALRQLVPPLMRRQMAALLPLAAGRVADTTMLSNLGRLPVLPRFGLREGPVREVWFSPPAPMPLGLSVGAATAGERLFLTLRHRYALLDARAAESFARLFRAVLLGRPAVGRPREEKPR
ncbi:MAG: condensation domain-containing protein [Burkholderiales bacterium]|nr:condensation domain-containing protein [Burkholderiales bacterium]